MLKRLVLAAMLGAMISACGGGDVAGPGNMTTVFPSAPWQWQNPRPHANDHIAIEALGGERAIALSQWEVIETRDGGDTWQSLGLGGFFFDLHRRGDVLAAVSSRVFVSEDNGTTWRATNYHGASRRAVAFWDGRHGVVVGDDGDIVTTSDGGDTWTFRFSGTNGILYDVAYLDSLTVFAVGGAAGGVVLRSTDGGVSWSQLMNTGVGFAGTAIDITSGVVRVSDSSRKLRASTDGGDTWSEVGTTAKELVAIDFFDAVFGIAAGDDGLVYLTSNGGVDWNEFSNGLDEPINAVSRAARNDLWAVGDNGALFRYTGGEWRALHAGVHMNLRDVSFANADVGMAVGQWYQGDLIPVCGFMRTADGGRNWESGLTTNCGAGNLNAVCMIDDDHAVVVGEGGGIWTTADGGATWIQRDSKTTLELFDVAFADASHGMAVGEFGQIRVSDDGGATWVAPVGGAGTNSNILSVSYATRDVVMLAGTEGDVRRSTSGGESFSWSPAEGGVPDVDVYDVVALDETTAVLRAASESSSNSYAAVWRTTDGGTSWELRDELYGRPSDGAMDFASATHGYVVHERGLMYTTKDGGVTWQDSRGATTSTVVTSIDLWGVCAIDDNNVVVVGDNGLIMRTSTGGR